MGEALTIRELYCPAHFGNYYEVAMSGEMDALLREGRFWGFNRYSDWFDTVDLLNVYTDDRRHYSLPRALWDRKFANFAAAARQGYDLGLVVTPNHVFLDQVTPETAAVHADRYFGQLVCPAKPGVTEMILGNYRRLFREFADTGLELAAISGGAYDYGGCDCEECRPWIVTFGKLFRRIVAEAREFFPDIRAEIWGWWWTDDDHRLFTDWADREAPGFFASFAHYIPYGEAEFAPRPLPAGCAERAFVHIGYGENGGIDVYGHYGPTVAPDRLERTVEFLRRRGAEGFLAYSEGVFDEINKALLAGLASGHYAEADAVLKAFAQRHLGGDAAKWARWLRRLGDIENMDVHAARADFGKVAARAHQSSRMKVLAEKLRLAEADRRVREATEWDDARRQAAADFLATKERIWRRFWRRGLGRAIFAFDWRMPPWYAEYAELANIRGGTLGRRTHADA